MREFISSRCFARSGNSILGIILRKEMYSSRDSLPPLAVVLAVAVALPVVADAGEDADEGPG